MAKIDLIPKSDLAFAAQLRAFKHNIPKFAATLGVTPEQVAGQAADADFYQYVVQCQQSMLSTTRGWTALRKIMRKGDSTADDKTLPTVLAHALPPTPTVVPFGIERRFRALAKQVKLSANFTASMGAELGIEAKSHAAPDLTTVRPELTATVNGDHVDLGWTWRGWRKFLDLCVIEVDRGDGRGFVPLLSSTRPGSKDITPFPAATAHWQYRAIYQVGDKFVGQWSRVANVLVGAS